MKRRSTFEAFRSRGVRVSSGAIGLVWVETGREELEVAIAAGKKLGTAVQRNKLRRRVKAALRELCRDPQGTLCQGAYLVIARPEASEYGFSQLRESLRDALERLAGAREAREGSQGKAKRD